MDDRLPLDRIPKANEKLIKCVVKNKDKSARKEATIIKDNIKETTTIQIGDKIAIIFKTKELKRLV